MNEHTTSFSYDDKAAGSGTSEAAGTELKIITGKSPDELTKNVNEALEDGGTFHGHIFSYEGQGGRQSFGQAILVRKQEKDESTQDDTLKNTRSASESKPRGVDTVVRDSNGNAPAFVLALRDLDNTRADHDAGHAALADELINVLNHNGIMADNYDLQLAALSRAGSAAGDQPKGWSEGIQYIRSAVLADRERNENKNTAKSGDPIPPRRDEIERQQANATATSSAASTDAPADQARTEGASQSGAGTTGTVSKEPLSFEQAVEDLDNSGARNAHDEGWGAVADRLKQELANNANLANDKDAQNSILEGLEIESSMNPVGWQEALKYVRDSLSSTGPADEATTTVQP